MLGGSSFGDMNGAFSACMAGISVGETRRPGNIICDNLRYRRLRIRRLVWMHRLLASRATLCRCDEPMVAVRADWTSVER